jgi:hypothetical protein
MYDAFTFAEAGGFFDPPPPPYRAAWAIKPRGPAHFINAFITSAIIRVRPVALLTLGLLLCGASGAGIVFLAVRLAA